MHDSPRSASRWHEDVSRSTSPALLEWGEETRRRFCSTMSHVLANKGLAPEASKITLSIRGSRVEVGARYDGLCDSLATDIARA